MKSLFILFSSLLITLSAWAVDYGQMEVRVRQNPAQYREMLKRFETGDSTMTDAEVAYVYYGFPFTPQYEPTDSFPTLHRAYDAKDYDEVLRQLPEALSLNPVSLDLMIMGLAAIEHGATPADGQTGRLALNLAIRCDQIASAILDSGSGTSAASPFWVICDSDRRRMLTNVITIGDILGTSRIGNRVAYKFTFPHQSRMHILYFDNTQAEKFSK